MLHRISAGAIVEYQNRLLLVRHQRPGAYDFWVCPGGGVDGDESLEAAAAREVREETGLDISVSKLLYIEELINPECRHVKFWFQGHLAGGRIDTSHPETVREFIVEAAWLTQEQLAGKVAFPEAIKGSYWLGQPQRLPQAVRLPLRHMEFW